MASFVPKWLRASTFLRRAVFLSGLLVVVSLASGCVRFWRPASSDTRESDAIGVGSLGDERLLSALSLDSVEDTDGLLLRAIVRPDPEYGFTVDAHGVVTFVGGFAVKCRGALSRHVDVARIRALIDELDALKLPTSRSAELGWSDVAEIRFGYRTNGEWREHVFMDIETNERLQRAFHLVKHATGVSPLRAPPRLVDGRLAPEDCNGKLFWP